MGKFKPGKHSKWENAPFTIGAEGYQFIPGKFGEKRASGPKTIKGSVSGTAKTKGTRVKRSKEAPRKVR